MSIVTPAPQPTAPATPAPAPATPPPAPAAATPAQETTDWKAEARKWEDRAKENKTAAEELAALKAAQMTEAEKAAARLAELESKVKGYETKEQIAAWKAEVAESTGVPAQALAGSTKEEIEAHAATLKPLIVAPDGKKGAIGPYVPPEGSAPSGDLGGDPAQQFADLLNNQLGR